MENFWLGFEKKAYDYEHESSNLKARYDQRSKETPVSARKAGLWGAGIGGAGGAILGALQHKGKGGMLPGLLMGGLLGAGIGGLAGVATAIADELGIEEAKRIMRMEDGARQSYLKSLARRNEISEQQYNEWSRDLKKERYADARHNELVSAMKERK